MIDEAERAKFVAWTFERQLELLEHYDGSFDRDAPNADLDIAGFGLELAAGTEDEDKEDAACPLVPHFLGYDMQWWASLCSDRQTIGDPGSLLDRLGIRDAVLAWVRDEDAWKKRRAAARRAAARQGRNWLGEMIPQVR